MQYFEEHRWALGMEQLWLFHQHGGIPKAANVSTAAPVCPESHRLDFPFLRGSQSSCRTVLRMQACDAYIHANSEVLTCEEANFSPRSDLRLAAG